MRKDASPGRPCPCYAAPDMTSDPRSGLHLPPTSDRRGYFHWYLRGVLASLSLPAFILASSFVGFAALALEAGVTMPQAVFMTAVVWALPSKVVLVGAIMAGSGIAAAAFAVALSAVRLTPMVVALVPEMRTTGTRRWVLFLLSHFVAVTSWVLAMERLRHVPEARRTAFYTGLGSTLVLLNMCVVAIVYLVARDLPPMASAALLLLTPIYFLTSLWASARERASHVAMVLGLVLGPLFHLVIPGASLLAAGLVGGLAAYGWHRYGLARRSP
jgi:predicted branched-subunit amino acid permease